MAIITTIGRLRTIIRTILKEAVAVDADTSRELLKKFPKGLQKFGVNPSNVDSLPTLGTGTRGTAFDIGGDRVLKVTNDAKEAEAAAAMVGKDIKNIVKYYAVWKFDNTGFYGITQEKLNPITEEEGKMLNDALVATGLPVWIHHSGYDWDKAKNLTKEYIVKQVKKEFKANHNSPEAKQFIKNINDKWSMLVTKFGLRDMFERLSQLGIDFHDYHAGNIMQRVDGTYVLIDLGMSKVKKSGEKIEIVVESANRRNR